MKWSVDERRSEEGRNLALTLILTFSLLPSVIASSYRWMAEHVTGKSRSQLSQPMKLNNGAPSTLPLSSTQHSHLCDLLRARAVDCEPLQYLLGSVSFLSLSLHVRAPTLIPRPETELMVAWILNRWTNKDYRKRHAHLSVTYHTSFEDMVPYCSDTIGESDGNGRNKKRSDGTPSQLASPTANTSSTTATPLRVLDLCSGSGNISLSLLHHLPSHCYSPLQMYGVDISREALKLARENLEQLQKRGACRAHDAQSICQFLEIDLMQGHEVSTDQGSHTTTSAHMRPPSSSLSGSASLLDVLAQPPAFVSSLLARSSSSLPPPSTSTSRSSSLARLLSSPSSGSFDLIVSNPPYIPLVEYASLQEEVREWEDVRALVGGVDGMYVYHVILNAAHALLKPTMGANDSQTSTASSAPPSPSSLGDVPELVLEIGSELQALSLSQRLQQLQFEHVTIHHDMAGLPRWIAAARKAKANG